ncbi:hypothetical protein SUGI_1521490 [Cryptomeria japonica]|uniref:Uncharacterized protein n=1 Tax=Cryptomeria japonica TaxID=3369 RepID=A0AAD3RRX0_CRYJA|nr:hypothetical protein SUGI_1521490 [Cryptomeria japonica]
MEMSYQYFPSVKIPEVKDDYLKFEPRNTDANIVNALLRVMMAEVPMIAVDLVEIGKNSSVLNDEFISQKLGLIPLTSKHAIEMSFLCDCDRGDGGAQCEHYSPCALVEFKTNGTGCYFNQKRRPESVGPETDFEDHMNPVTDSGCASFIPGDVDDVKMNSESKGKRKEGKLDNLTDGNVAERDFKLKAIEIEVALAYANLEALQFIKCKAKQDD